MDVWWNGVYPVYHTDHTSRVYTFEVVPISQAEWYKTKLTIKYFTPFIKYVI